MTIDTSPEAIAAICDDLTHTGELSMLYRMEMADAITALSARVAELEAQSREDALQYLATSGQAADAYDAQQRLEAENARLRGELQWQADQPEAHPFMALRARAALEVKP